MLAEKSLLKESHRKRDGDARSHANMCERTQLPLSEVQTPLSPPLRAGKNHANLPGPTARVRETVA